VSVFIVIEGPDRCGKATQTHLLSIAIRNLGYSVATVEVPIADNPMYHVIYWMLANGFAKKYPKIFQWCQYFNRQIFQWSTLPKLERLHDYVIMDRWSLSTVVYGVATGVPEEYTEDLYDRLRRPDHTIILLGTPHRHDAEDVYESDEKLQAHVRDLYATWSLHHPNDSFVVDCSRSREDITRAIMSRLADVGLLIRTAHPNRSAR
jgi:thymidylate kinase